MTANEPLSQQIYEAGMAYAEANRIASKLEGGKSIMLAKLSRDLGDMPVNAAERQVKASDDWAMYIKGMHDARYEADRLRLEYYRLRDMMTEWQSQQANERLIAKL